MGAYRCSTCSINYPGYLNGGKCKVCETRIDWISNCDPDLDWQDKVEEKDRVNEVSYVTPWPIPNVDADIHYLKDEAWLAHNDLLEAGYRCLENFQVVRVRNRFYELQAHVGRTLTHGVTGGAWWIQEVDTTPEFPYPVLGPEEYAALEERRGAEPL